MASTSGLIARGVPPMPQWMLYLKVAILFFSLLLLAVSAYGVSLGAYYVYTGAAGFMLFIAIKTMLIFGAAVAVELMAPQMFYRVLALGIYLLSIIFWLSGWAWAATWATAFCYRGCSKYGGAIAAIAAIGAFTWVLSLIHFAFFVKFSMASPQATPGNAELGAVKPEQPYVTAQYPAGQPAPQYTGQYAQPPPQQQPYQQQQQQPYQQQQQMPYQQQPQVYQQPQPYTQ